MPAAPKPPVSIKTAIEKRRITEEPGLATVRRLRAEANLVRFPFFDLVREAAHSTRDILEVREVKRGPDGLKVESVWRVSRSVDTAFPGELARRIHREVLEKIISESPRPIQNPICLGSYRDIASMLGIKISGNAARRIKAAMRSVVGATIHSKNTICLKSRKRYLEESFHLYEKVAFIGDTLPDGHRADAIYVVLAPWYLENLNANYVAPLDFEYFRQIQGSIPSRMYELLHHWFFVALRSGHRTIERRYSTLCEYFPLARQDTLWKAKKQLRDAHRQHLENGYLACLPKWCPVRGTKNDWTLVYTPGPAAHTEYRRNQNRRSQDGIAPDELPSVTRLALPPSGPSLSDVQRDLLKELELRGITSSIASDLVQKHEPTIVQNKIEAFDWLVSKKDHRITKNPAGYLRTSIEQDYASPDGFASHEERKQRAAAEAAQRQAEMAAEAQANQAQQDRTVRLEALFTSLPTEKRQQLYSQALEQLNDFARRAYQRELQEGRQSIGHHTLKATIHKLLEADSDDGGSS